MSTWAEPGRVLATHGDVDADGQIVDRARLERERLWRRRHCAACGRAWVEHRQGAELARCREWFARHDQTERLRAAIGVYRAVDVDAESQLCLTLALLRAAKPAAA